MKSQTASRNAEVKRSFDKLLASGLHPKAAVASLAERFFLAKGTISSIVYCRSYSDSTNAKQKASRNLA